MRLDYFDCISPLPLYLHNVGSIISPKLIDIAKISYYVYAQYVSHLRMTPEDYCDVYLKSEQVNFEQLFQTTKFDLVLTDDRFRQIITSALNFFFVETFQFYPEYKAFISTSNNNGELVATGIINRDNYAGIIDIILQRVHITPDENEIDDIKKAKNKRGIKIYKRMMEVRKKFQKNKGSNPNLTLPNIIASVAAKSESQNWSNIWDITIFQLFDVFERLQVIDSYGIISAQVAAWGDKENKFKFGLWTNNIYDDGKNTE
ncbi:hypothetical protein H8S37_04630 [Mediterraneibacter sp. NSJ-55]|uniref:Uncharacterized protein n=1 Tax=Mediterraneibacter hominis TaxID=2763054 RepID=A0A923RP74_9FIRM|nr:hypothetical protein [Mediterraneibacter hominis]MBC5688214.1 hypothetical protein [Mediterraneibacter hominis]